MWFDRTQVRRGQPDTSPQQTGTSRTVKRYPSSSAPITSNALPSNNGYANSRSGVQNWNGQRKGHGGAHSASTHRPGSNNLLHGPFNNALSPAGNGGCLLRIYFLGYMGTHPVVFVIKSIRHKENKQSAWMYLTFPTVTPPYPICGLRQARQADVCYQTASKHARLCDPDCKERECVPECTVTLIPPGICHLSDMTGAEHCCPRRKRNAIPGSDASPASRASCLLFMLFLVFRQFQSNGFWTASHHYTTFTRTHAAFVSLTHPKHPLLKIKGLPNSTLSLICWPMAHQSSCYSLPLASC